MFDFIVRKIEHELTEPPRRQGRQEMQRIDLPQSTQRKDISEKIISVSSVLSVAYSIFSWRAWRLGGSQF